MEQIMPDIQPGAPLKHSGIGIASFIISLVIGIFFVILFLGAGFIGIASPETMYNESVMILIGLFAILGLFVCLTGIGLGIGGLFQKKRKKVFAALGLIFNVLVLFGVIFLIILGNTMS
jgi:hypothetical protein